MRIPYLATPATATPLLRSLPESVGISPQQAALALEEFLSTGRATTVLSGAGISVDSNIPDYRGPSGTYTLNNAYRPIFFHEFVTLDKARRRYWARSFLGYPPVQRAQPNYTHRSLAKLSIDGIVKHQITQNVDGLLHTAFEEVSVTPDKLILELHGSLRDVICLHCHKKTSRTHIQSQLERLNPRWAPLLAIDDKNLKTNADGDVDLQASSLNMKEVLQYNTFRYPPCPYCLEKYAGSDMLQVDSGGAWKGGTAGIIKPAVIFFGENVSHEIRDHVNEIIEMSDQLLIMGTTLAVLSAQRLVRLAKSQGKRIAVMTSGYVRNEEMLVQDGDLRIWWRSSDVLKHLSYLSGLK